MAQDIQADQTANPIQNVGNGIYVGTAATIKDYTPAQIQALKKLTGDVPVVFMGHADVGGLFDKSDSTNAIDRASSLAKINSWMPQGIHFSADRLQGKYEGLATDVDARNWLGTPYDALLHQEGSKGYYCSYATPSGGSSSEVPNGAVVVVANSSAYSLITDRYRRISGIQFSAERFQDSELQKELALFDAAEAAASVGTIATHSTASAREIAYSFVKQHPEWFNALKDEKTARAIIDGVDMFSNLTSSVGMREGWGAHTDDLRYLSIQVAATMHEKGMLPEVTESEKFRAMINRVIQGPSYSQFLMGHPPIDYAADKTGFVEKYVRSRGIQDIQSDEARKAIEKLSDDAFNLGDRDQRRSFLKEHHISEKDVRHFAENGADLARMEDLNYTLYLSNPNHGIKAQGLFDPANPLLNNYVAIAEHLAETGKLDSMPDVKATAAILGQASDLYLDRAAHHQAHQRFGVQTEHTDIGLASSRLITTDTPPPILVPPTIKPQIQFAPVVAPAPDAQIRSDIYAVQVTGDPATIEPPPAIPPKTDILVHIPDSNVWVGPETRKYYSNEALVALGNHAGEGPLIIVSKDDAAGLDATKQAQLKNDMQAILPKSFNLQDGDFTKIYANMTDARPGEGYSANFRTSEDSVRTHVNPFNRLGGVIVVPGPSYDINSQRTSSYVNFSDKTLSAAEIHDTALIKAAHEAGHVGRGESDVTADASAFDFLQKNPTLFSNPAKLQTSTSADRAFQTLFDGAANPKWDAHSNIAFYKVGEMANITATGEEVSYAGERTAVVRTIAEAMQKNGMLPHLGKADRNRDPAARVESLLRSALSEAACEEGGKTCTNPQFLANPSNPFMANFMHTAEQLRKEGAFAEGPQLNFVNNLLEGRMYLNADPSEPAPNPLPKNHAGRRAHFNPLKEIVHGIGNAVTSGKHDKTTKLHGDNWKDQRPSPPSAAPNM